MIAQKNFENNNPQNCRTDDKTDTSKCCDHCAGKKWCNPGKWSLHGTNARADITNCWISPKSQVVAIGRINYLTIKNFKNYRYKNRNYHFHYDQWS